MDPFGMNSWEPEQRRNSYATCSNCGEVLEEVLYERWVLLEHTTSDCLKSLKIQIETLRAQVEGRG